MNGRLFTKLSEFFLTWLAVLIEKIEENVAITLAVYCSPT